MTKFFLNSNNGVFSIDKEGKLITSLPNKSRLLPIDDLSRTLSLNDQYNKERDECRRFRLIVNLNPICSNVLFNVKSEIVVGEGTDDAKVLMDDGITEWPIDNSGYKPQNTKKSITYYDAIRNTEYSHPELGGYIYHCGVDIFNNHMLRNNDFVHVNYGPSEVFNTIEDYARYCDDNGSVVVQNIGFNTGTTESDGYIRMHMYQYDTILKMKRAFIERCEEVDGWWGFINPSFINTTNGYNKINVEDDGDKVRINQMLSSNKPCEFIDLYPDRSLFSFVPKYNKYRRRIEKNWDYCITYPYENDYEFIKELGAFTEKTGQTKSETNNGIKNEWYEEGEKLIDGINGDGAIRINYNVAYNTNGIKVLRCESYLHHTFKQGDQISLSYVVKQSDEGTNDGYVLIKSNKTFKIETIGDVNGNYKDRIFTIKYAELLDLVDTIDNDYPIYYRKHKNGTNCDYYVRKFKKLTTIDNKPLRSDINKVAFGRNIYGDDISQIIFTDDIDINGLFDNNGRPVSEVYLTIVKRNKGWKEWANSGICSAVTTEYSHCFGKVTSGIDFKGLKVVNEYFIDADGDGDKDDTQNDFFELIEPIDYNIRRMHNVVSGGSASDYYNTIYANTIKAWGTGLERLPKTIESFEDKIHSSTTRSENGITIDDDTFWGDIVEMDPTTYTENVIGVIFHRFNTTQRECLHKRYQNVFQDMIVSDDYDIFQTGNPDDNGNNSTRTSTDQSEGRFKVLKYYLNDLKDETLNAETPFSPEPDPKGDGTDNEHNDDEETDTTVTRFYGCIMPEGYFYKPHSKIQLLAEDDEPVKSEAMVINYSSAGTSYRGDVKEFTFKAPTNFGFYKGDNIAFYNFKNYSTIWSEIVKVENNTIVTVRFPKEVSGLTINSFITTSDNIDGREYIAFWSPDNVPTYAKLSIGERKFVWKRLLPQSELMSDNILYDTPFTNGRLYIEQNINFFLRRQDPTGEYGLSKAIYREGEVYLNPIDNYIIRGYEPYDFTINELATNNFDNCY